MAGNGVLGEVAHEALLVENGALATQEGELAGYINIVLDVRQTHMVQGAVVGLVGVVAEGKLPAVESGVDAPEDQGGVGGEFEEERTGVPALALAWVGGGHAHQSKDCKIIYYVIHSLPF